MTDKSQTTATPSGVVGIYTDKEGRVIASVSDFDLSGYGGFTLRQGQEIRCKRRLCAAVIDAYCSGVIGAALDAYECERIVGKLTEKGGKATFIPVGCSPHRGISGASGMTETTPKPWRVSPSDPRTVEAWNGTAWEFDCCTLTAAEATKWVADNIAEWEELHAD